MTTIKQRITQEHLAGHSAAADKIAESIGERITGLRIGDAVLSRQINQDVAALRIITQEFTEMRGDGRRAI